MGIDKVVRQVARFRALDNQRWSGDLSERELTEWHTLQRALAAALPDAVAAAELADLRETLRIKASGSVELGDGRAELVDLSHGGVGLVADFAPPANAVLPIVLPLREPLAAKVEVLWAVPDGDQFRVGARFFEPGPEVRAGIGNTLYKALESTLINPSRSINVQAFR